MARESPCPVFVVRAPQGVVGVRPPRILVPTTGGAQSELAAELAVAIARATGAGISRLSVIEERTASLFWLSARAEHPVSVAQQVSSRVAELARPYGVWVNTLVRQAAHAGPEILRAAHDTSADLILLSGSLRPTQRLFLGHTVSHVLNHAPCTVAVPMA